MKLLRPAALLGSALLFAALGCHSSYAPPPPPPPPYGQAPPLVQLAERNGFETGRADGARDVERGFAYAPRHTRGWHDCPGYDPQLGPSVPIATPSTTPICVDTIAASIAADVVVDELKCAADMMET